MTTEVHGDAGIKFPDNSRMARIPRAWIDGLTLSRAGTSVFGVAVGQAASDDNAQLMDLTAALTKTTAVWQAGSGNGGLDTGALPNNTWYHAFLIRRPDTGAVDALLSLSPTAPTMPANYTQKRRIGSLLTTGSAQITDFVQRGDLFLWDTPVVDANLTNPGSNAVLRTLTVPTGVVVEAYFTMVVGCLATSTIAYASSPDQPDVAAGFSTVGTVGLAGGFGTG